MENVDKYSNSSIIKNVFAASGMLSFALILGRISGLFREIKIASTYGLSDKADAAIILISIPDLLVNLLVAGGLSAVLVPTFRSLAPEAAAQLHRRALTVSFGAFGFVALIFYLVPDFILYALAPGFASDFPFPHIAIAFVAFSIPITAFSGVTSAYLNANDRFLIAGLGTLVFNVIVITGLMFANDDDGMLILSLAILVAAAVRWISQLPCVPREAWSIRHERVANDDVFVRPFLIGTIATSLILVPPVLVRAAASLLESGNIAAFNYAQKIVELPTGVLLTAISLVALSKLSGYYNDGLHELAKKTVISGIRISLLISCCILCFAYPLMEYIVDLLFNYGKMQERELLKISELTRISILVLPFISITSMLSSMLYSMKRVNAVLYSNIISLILCIFFTIPGIVYSNSQLLMLSITASQICLAWFLAKATDIRIFTDGAIFNRRYSVLLLGAVALCLPFAFLASSLASVNIFFGFAVAGSCFLVVMAIAVRRLMAAEAGQG